MIFIGDIHGNFTHLNREIQRAPENSNFIQVGDFGIGFSMNQERYLHIVDDTLKEKSSKLYVIRGNHDNPRYFRGIKIYENIEFVKDYTILNIEDKNILCIGGGISLDRSQRKSFRDWWADEIVVEDLPYLQEKIAGETIDIVATHIAPTFVEPIGLNSFVCEWIEHDPKDLKTELLREREYMSTVYDLLKTDLKHWFYGHYHANFYFNTGQTIFHGLGVGETKFIY